MLISLKILRMIKWQAVFSWCWQRNITGQAEVLTGSEDCTAKIFDIWWAAVKQCRTPWTWYKGVMMNTNLKLTMFHWETSFWHWIDLESRLYIMYTESPLYQMVVFYCFRLVNHQSCTFWLATAWWHQSRRYAADVSLTFHTPQETAGNCCSRKVVETETAQLGGSLVAVVDPCGCGVFLHCCHCGL